MLASFSERARNWDQDPKRHALIADVAKALGKALPLHPDWAVLDYGCGTGALSFALLPQVASITAADASAGMVEVTLAKREALSDPLQKTKLEVLRLDLLEEDPPARQYDLIVACLVLHHIEDAFQILNAFASLLKDGGYLAIVEWEVPAQPRPSTLPHVITRRSPDDWGFELSKTLQPAKVRTETIHFFERDDGSISPAILITAGPIRRAKSCGCSGCGGGGS